MTQLRFTALVFLVCLTAGAQTQTLATFGVRIPIPGTFTDLVLDEGRQRLYLVNNANNRIEVFSIPDKQLLTPISVGQQPVSAAMSPDGQFLFVTNFAGSSLSMIDLAMGGVINTVNLPAPPQGVAVGFDGRAVISTIGTGVANGVPQNTLLILDPTQTGPAQLTAVPVPPAAPLDPRLGTFTPARPFVTFGGRLLATPDGHFIVGVNTPTGTTTVTFVYEVASGTVLRVRQTVGVSSTLSVSADGSRFMAGFRMFETLTLSMLAQTNTANAPFAFPATFSQTQNIGGSIFAPDGNTLYSAFNVAPAIPQVAPRPNSSTLLLSNPRNLGINLGIRLPESILGKMVITSDSGTVFALSETGILMLPVGKLYDFPIIMPETTAVRLSINPCDRALVTTEVKINNAGKGKLTFTFGQPGQGLLAQAVSGVAPSSIRLILNPRVTRLPGTTPFALTLVSPEAINIPPVIRVYQNFQTGGQTGETIPIETAVGGTGGLTDMQVDNRRGLVYLTNQGMNRIEVYDFRNRKMLPPIEVGQLPQSMTMTSDGSLLYVANLGGEWVSIVDLDQRVLVGKVDYPPVPFNGTQPVFTPRSIAMGIFGPQFVASNGALWSVRNNTAIPRGATLPGSTALTVASPAGMVSTPGNESIILMDFNGRAYRYDSFSDTYTNVQTVMTNISSYYGALAAGPTGQYYIANRAILNGSLVPTGGIIAGAGGTPTPGGGGAGGAAATASSRHQPAAVAVNDKTFARFTVPPQTGATPIGDQRPLVELVDLATQASLVTVAAPEGPPQAIFGNVRVLVNPRQMAVDGTGSNAFLITMSGLSIVSLRQASATDKPVINNNGIVNGATFNRTVAPGALISIFGRNLADNGTASALPLPEVLGGSCVTFNDLTLPLLSTSPTQINAQLPPGALPGTTEVVVHSIVTGLQSDPALVNVSRNAPGVFALSGNQAALFHGIDFSPVTRSSPGQRNEVLVLFGTGIPAAAGSQLQPGQPAPLDPLVLTVPPRVFIGNPDQAGTEMRIEWSGFTPGFVGLNQINLHVPPNAVTGDNLPVVVRVDDAESPRSGPLAPVTSIR